MGWGRFLLLGNLGQQLDIVDQKAEIENLRDELHRSRVSSPGPAADVARLQAENDELRLYLAAIVRLLTAKGVVRPDEIKQMVDVIDTQDGARDGRYDGKIA
jgi:hypothetical protein